MRCFFLFILIPILLFSFDLENRVATLEKEMRQVDSQNEKGNFCASFATSKFEKGGVGFQFFANALYWHSKVGEAEYVYELATEKKKSIGTQGFDWDWGYKVGAGISLPIVRWKVIGAYLHYETQDSQGKGALPPSLLISLKRGSMPFLSKARSDYKISYSAAELELHQSYFLSRLLGLETLLGIKKAWIEQKQGATYQEGKGKTRVQDECHFVGLGPAIGCSGKWGLLYGLSFIASAKGSLLFGSFEVRHTEKEISLIGNTHFFTPTLYFLLGLQWDYPTKWTQFSLSLGYEAEYFWRQNQPVEIESHHLNSLRFQVIRYAEDLTFYGGTFKAALQF